MKRFFTAVTFLTRLPAPQKAMPEARDIGRATVCFPLVGALIGLIQMSALQLFAESANGNSLKSVLVAAMLVVVNVFVTGALHLDGLADMADGFGGGQTKERTLEIMRDSLIGSYGAVALILLLFVKVAAIAALIESSAAWQILIVAPALARWAIVPLGKFAPYARKSGGLGKSITDYVGWSELFGASFFAGVVVFGLLDWRSGAVLWLIAVAATLFIARFSLRKIGGITGDVLGANAEVCETAILFAWVFLR